MDNIQAKRIEGIVVDTLGEQLFEGSVEVENGFIKAINKHNTASCDYIMCGFVDSHVHIESSMLSPVEFGRLVIARGTVAVVADPHEIANVLGVRGVDFMLENSTKAPIKCFFTIPSSVPATAFDATGGEICTEDVEAMASTKNFVGLSEVMNVPGVLGGDSQVLSKLEAAKKYGLVIDGHSPALSGSPLAEYIAAGISTDHESFELDEALEKLSLGMKIHIREGSAARNFDALCPLIASHADRVMFCTDDSHPDDILSGGHIDKHVRRAIEKGYDLFDVLKIASTNAIDHYGLDVGQLRVGDKADFIVVDNLRDFSVKQVFVDGIKRYDSSEGRLDEDINFVALNNFSHRKISPQELAKPVGSTIQVMELIENQIVTQRYDYSPSRPTSNLESDLEHDILKIAYLNRYRDGRAQVAYCKGFGLGSGAIASSISHDSHNIIAVGCSDSELTEAINAVVENKGALAVHYQGGNEVLPLPLAGIMSDLSGAQVARQYSKMGGLTHQMGCTMLSPFMTLSFLALVVIPELKIGEKGLFSYTNFNWVEQ